MYAVDISVLVPVYNNAATLDELIDRVIAVLEPLGRSFELLFVDDGSRDESLAIVQRRAAVDSRVRWIAMVRNFGSQAASCAAFDHARGRRLVHIDADLEQVPEDIPILVEHLDRGYDLVCPYRETRGGPWLTRRLPSLLMNAYVRRQTGTRVRDVGCGMRAMDAAIVRDLASEGESRRLLTPLLLRRARRIVEVPIRHHPRSDPGGHSFLTLLGIALDYYMLTARRPFLISGLVSLAALAIGVIMLAVGPRPAGLVLAGFASVGALVSLLGEYAQRIYQLGQGIPFYSLRDPGEQAPADDAVRSHAAR